MATRKLVDSLAEHEVLEQLLEASKPALPLPRPAAEDRDPWRNLHYLLATPFRYPPLRYGSRFGRRFERGIWYGAARISTVLAEVAFYRLRFIAESSAELGPVHADFTLFQSAVATPDGVDLSRRDTCASYPQLVDPCDYQFCQVLGTQMRAAGIMAFKFCSARDPRGGANVGVFGPQAFQRKQPLVSAVWHSVSTAAGVEFRHSLQRVSRWFGRELFLVDGSLPKPGA